MPAAISTERPYGNNRPVSVGRKLSAIRATPTISSNPRISRSKRSSERRRNNDEPNGGDNRTADQGHNRRGQVGERAKITPNDVCPTVNLMDELLIARDGKIVDAWKVAARGKVR